MMVIIRKIHLKFSTYLLTVSIVWQQISKKQYILFPLSAFELPWFYSICIYFVTFPFILCLFPGPWMVWHLPPLCGGVSAEESPRAADFLGPALPPTGDARPQPHRAGGPHPAHQGRRPRPRQPQLQEDEEDTDGGRLRDWECPG